MTMIAMEVVLHSPAHIKLGISRLVRSDICAIVVNMLSAVGCGRDVDQANPLDMFRDCRAHSKGIASIS